MPESDLIFTFSSRRHQNMSLSYGETRNSLNNRRDFLSNLGINHHDLVCAKQIHADGIRHVKEDDIGRGALSFESAIADTDAFITDKKNIPLAIFTADCLSVFLYDPQTPAIGIVHAGWRSTRENITAKAIKLMQKIFNSKTDSLSVTFGPSIRSCCYEVGGDFSDYFRDGLIKKSKRYYLDLVKINQKQAQDLGVKDKNIADSKICTFCRNQDFFSFRKEGESCGRMMSVIMLK